MVPVFQAEHSLPELCRRIEETCASLAVPFEIILVDDGSPDDAWKVISCLAGSEPRIRGIRLEGNYGQHNASLCGIREARLEWTVTLDDDLQHPPEEISKLLLKSAEGYDLIYGKSQKSHHGWWRDLASQWIRSVIRLFLKKDWVVRASAFRLLRTDLRAGFASYHQANVILELLLSRSTDRVGFVAVRRDPRHWGTSTYGMKKLVRHVLNIVSGINRFPFPYLCKIWNRSQPGPCYLVGSKTEEPKPERKANLR